VNIGEQLPCVLHVQCGMSGAMPGRRAATVQDMRALGL
jgi:hypothetical protein